LFALIWGMTKWNNSSSEIKALGFSPAKRNSLTAAPDHIRQPTEKGGVSFPAPASVTDKTTNLLDQPATRPPGQRA
ncbi:MAG: hypothetical protein WAV20_01160, partial [Blastocatellia bacterium]